MLDLGYIFETFKNLPSAKDKVEFLKTLPDLNLPFSINYENLIAAWEKIAKSELEVEEVVEA
jgi:hypothetical protein